MRRTGKIEGGLEMVTPSEAGRSAATTLVHSLHACSCQGSTLYMWRTWARARTTAAGCLAVVDCW
jgi:hypothetical protein